MWKLTVLLVLNICSLTHGLQPTSICCLQARSSECSKNCRKLLRRARILPTHKYRLKYRYVSRRLTDVVRTCPRSEVQFWRCLENSDMWKDFRVISQKKQRSHAVCCKEAHHVSCEVQCLTTKNVTQLQNENCDAVREPKFAQCVFKVQASKSCCHDTSNMECKKACMHYFKNTGSDPVLKRKSEVKRTCGKKSKQFQCIVNQSDYGSVIRDLTQCCSRGKSRKCEQTCKKTLRNSVNFGVMFNSLEEPCGSFDPKDAMYKCFMDVASNKPARETTKEVIDTGYTSRTSQVSTSFKAQCCARAKSQQCHYWCLETISSSNLMGMWDNYLSCIQDPKEVELSTCMSDILEPCQIDGKTEMKFCSNFNNRPFELFRRNDEYGDSAAQKLHKFWSDGVVGVLHYNLVFTNISTCEPEKFKALACLLAVKPCSHHIPQKQVCRSDCEFLLGKCLDMKATSIGVSISKVCAAILPNANQTECLSVSDYITKPPKVAKTTRGQVTLPCKDSPCKSDEVCMVSNSCDKRFDPTCEDYICVKGCPVSRKNKLIIPIGQFAKLNVDEEGKDCYQVCECKIELSSEYPHTYFGDCRQFSCNTKQNCTLKSKIFYDGDVISDDCNTCICNDGEVVCSQKNCKTAVIESRIELPCNCTDVYNPICGLNGMTYPNSCLAKCAVMDTESLDVGDCQAVDPCDPQPCTHGLTCTPKKQVCLSPSSHCPQYTCSLEAVQRYHLPSPTCKKTESLVCGFDAVTYKNKCHAEKAATGVDYDGPCLSKEYSNLAERSNRCEKIKCPKMTDTKCNLIVPRGACCPICGFVIRMLYSQKDLIRHQNYISYEPITVVDVVKMMRQLLRVSECSLFGHLTVEGDFMLLLKVSTRQPTRGQIHACHTEAERLNKYINSKSPVVATNYYLSILKASTLQSGQQNALAERSTSSSEALLKCFCSWTFLFLSSFASVLLLS